MIYIDSSCLVKVFRLEPESTVVVDAVGREGKVVVSVLAQLEVLVQLKADFLSGNLSRPSWRQLEARFSILCDQPPYELRDLPAALFQTALRQHQNSRDKHCRSLDRLHLAAMEVLKVSRLMTHDERQAKAAIEAGFEVLQPGRH